MNKLTDRLRNFEAEAIRLANSEIPTEFRDIEALYKERLDRLDRSHSRSWFGDHTSTYYQGFQPPPPGRSFDVEWGFVPGINGSHNLGWKIYSRDEIREFVFGDIGEAIFHQFHEISEKLESEFQSLHDQAIDALELAIGQVRLGGISRYIERVKKELVPYTFGDFVNARSRSIPRMTRDSEEIAKGSAVPAHVQYQSAIQSFEVNKERLRKLAEVIRNVFELMELSEPIVSIEETGNRVFIGHGGSQLWRVLKDFINDRLNLDYEEFNRVPVAGIGTQERLAEMVSHCGFALLVLTAEDVHLDDSFHARENVIHEAGLFQGKLGWRKAIVLLEEGCEEFSNIVGLVQLRFPKGNISAVFEDVRAVLEREKFLN